MFRHVVMFSWTEDATDEAKQAALEAVGGLPDMVASIRSFSVGTDAGLAEGNFDACVVADFDDEAGYITYRDHPDHVRVVTELLRPIASGRAAVQYQL
ncbi:MAG: Dabb family protein [Acidimicrobiales bacterium]